MRCRYLSRSDNRGGLDVMSVQVALQVEVGQLVSISDGQELLQCSVRLDVVLVLQALFLDVVVDGLGDFTAAHQSAVGLAQELAEFISDLGGALEDAQSARLCIRALLDLAATLALASILDFTVDTLLELLDLREHGGDSLLQSVQVASDSLDILIQGGDGASGGGNRGSLDRGGGNNYRGSCSSGNGLLAAGLLFSGGSGNSGNRGSNGGCDFNDGVFLCDLLGSSLGRG